MKLAREERERGEAERRGREEREREERGDAMKWKFEKTRQDIMIDHVRYEHFVCSYAVLLLPSRNKTMGAVPKVH
jgi:hypothetical protein